MSLATITSLRRNLQEWALRPSNAKFLKQDQETQLRRGLTDPTRRAQAQVAGWMLGTWHLGHGMHRLLDGDSGGIDEVRQGQGLRRASLLARLAAPDSGRGRRGERVRLPFSLQHGAWTALLGLSLRDPGAEPLYAWLLELPDIAFSEKDSLPFFTRELLALRAGRRVNRSSRLGPYEEVLRHWQGDERLLARALVDVLDWHLQQARGSGADFDDPACRLCPLEALAVQEVRSWLELATPKVDHPLMHGALGRLSARTAWPQHELTRRLERLS